MPQTNTFGTRWSGGSAPPVSINFEITDEDNIGQDFIVPAGAVNLEKTIGFAVAGISGLVITVEGQDSAVTLLTNSTGAPDHTKVYAISKGITEWKVHSTEPNPFGSTDVTTMFWSNPGTEDARVKVRILLNATP